VYIDVLLEELWAMALGWHIRPPWAVTCLWYISVLIRIISYEKLLEVSGGFGLNQQLLFCRCLSLKELWAMISFWRRLVPMASISNLSVAF
jgi:hypothetical protein